MYCLLYVSQAKQGQQDISIMANFRYRLGTGTSSGHPWLLHTSCHYDWWHQINSLRNMQLTILVSLWRRQLDLESAAAPPPPEPHPLTFPATQPPERISVISVACKLCLSAHISMYMPRPQWFDVYGLNCKIHWIGPHAKTLSDFGMLASCRHHVMQRHACCIPYSYWILIITKPLTTPIEEWLATTSSSIQEIICLLWTRIRTNRLN
jgi:hypothetical protein